MQPITDEFHLLGEPFVTRSSPCRPPWAIAERPFIQVCDHCGDCVDACPEHILVRGRGDYPEVDFSRGGCTYCGKCSTICEPGGLRSPDTHPWHLKAFIANTCVTNRDTDCTDCSDSCPVSAISFRPQVGHTRVPILEEMLCNGCGSCVSACPEAAISVYSLI